MKNAKKIIALLLAVMMVAAVFAGCGDKNKPVATTAPATTGGNSETTAAAGNDTTAAQDEEPFEMTLMIDIPIPDDSLSRKWLDKIEEKCNVKIATDTPAASAYQEKQQLMLLEDEKPDMILFYNEWLDQDSFRSACDSGMFYDISDMLKDYPNIMEYTAQRSWDALDMFHDGRIWGVPRTSMVRNDGFEIRKDWLDALNIDYTEGDYLTIDEFFDILYKFTYDDPDGNGIDDTIGMECYSNADGSLGLIFPAIFGVGGGYVEEPDGTYCEIKYSRTNDAYKKYLAFANKCWEAGVLEPDAFAIDGMQATERRKQNMYGVW